MQLTVEISEDQAQALIELARKHGLSKEDLAKAALVDMLSVPSGEFQTVVGRVLMKNAELYRRLA